MYTSSSASSLYIYIALVSCVDCRAVLKVGPTSIMSDTSVILALVYHELALCSECCMINYTATAYPASTCVRTCACSLPSLLSTFWVDRD